MMTTTQASPNGNFAAMLRTAMATNKLTARELSKKLGISYEHTRRLQANEALPSSLLVEKVAGTVGIELEAARQAAQRDRMQRKFGTQMIAEAAGATSERVEMFAPLINQLLPEQVPHALSMLTGLVSAALLNRRLSVTKTAPKKEQKHLLEASGRKFRDD